MKWKRGSEMSTTMAYDPATVSGITHWLVNERCEGWDNWNDNAVYFFNSHFNFFLAVSILYLPLTFGLKRIMRDREPFGLRIPLIMWNIFMSLFSLVGSYYTIGPFLRVWFIEGHGIHYSLCTMWAYQESAAGKWAFLFNLSKVMEFTDTLFIVLRKKPLIFLHYYHHLVTFLFVWYSQTHNHYYENTLGLFFVAMNFGVHAIMYGYYACRSLSIKPPVDIFITILQIAQMVGGIYFLHSSTYCKTYDVRQLYMGYALYFSFFLLFCRVFYSRYIASKSPRQGRSSGRQPKGPSKKARKTE